ncbi:MAG: hypothetical protein NC926_06920 [Candidatus Omnitrophica bacterium]|nr:hypothetical protein [Candidatus Omnitrophota bacterium]
MKKIMFFCFVIFSSMFISTSSNSQENLLKNGSFEIDENNDGIPDGWRIRSVQGSTCKYELDEKVYHSGKRSGKIIFDPKRESYDEGYYVCDFKNFEVGKTYLFFGHVKAENFNGRATLSISFLDKSNKSIQSISKQVTIKDNLDWKKLQVKGIVPEGCVNIRIFTDTFGGPGGIVWWDSLGIYEISEEMKEQIAMVISNFEKEEDVKLWSPQGVKVERTKENASEGQYAIKVFFPGSEIDTWPGIYKEFFVKESDWTNFDGFAFDVYNPSDEIVNVYLRIDDRDGNKTFLSYGCLPQKVTKVIVETDSLSDINLKRLKGILVYLRMPRKDYTLFFDNFRFLGKPVEEKQDKKVTKLDLEKKILVEKDFTELFFLDDFEDKKINEKLWQFTDEGIEIVNNKCILKENSQLMSNFVYPYGILEVKSAFEKQPTTGALAFGWREKFGAKPRITISVEESNPQKIRCSIYDDEGNINWWYDLIPFDTNYHIYKIVWESNNVIKFYVDGELKVKNEIKEKISPRPITFYNFDSDGILSIDYVRFYTSKEIKENIDIFQVQKFEIPKLKFIEVKYVDEKPMPKLSSEETKRGYIFFKRPYIDLIFPNTIPYEEEIMRDNILEVFVSPGEYEPVTFAIRALKDLKNYQIDVSDLVSKERNKITKENIRIGIVRTLNKRRLYNINWSNEYINIPVYIEERNLVDIPKDTNKQIWLTIKIPENAKAGVYFGEINFAPILGSEAGEKATLYLKVNVLPIKLEEPKGKLYGMYYTCKRNSKAEILNDFKNMKEYGMTTVGLCIPFSPEEVIEEKDGFKFKFKDNDRFIWCLECYKEVGFTEPILLLSGPDQYAYNYLSRSYSDTSKEFEDKFKKFMLSFMEEAKKRNWPKMIFQPFDEPSWQSQELMRKTLRALVLLKDLGLPTETDGPFDEFMKKAEQYSDYLNINGGLAPLDILRELKKKGKFILMYNNDVEGYRPEVMRYSVGYYMWITEIDGVFNWEYQGIGKDPYNDLKHISPNFIYWYPKTERETGGPAITYEAFREGIDDYRYLLTYKNLVEKLKNQLSKNAEYANFVIESERKIKDLLSKIKFTTRIREQAKWTEELLIGPGEKIITGSLKLPNGLDFKDYDEIRKKIIDEIIKLQNILK